MLSSVRCLFEVGDYKFKLKTACLIIWFFFTNFHPLKCKHREGWWKFHGFYRIGVLIKHWPRGKDGGVKDFSIRIIIKVNSEIWSRCEGMWGEKGVLMMKKEIDEISRMEVTVRLKNIENSHIQLQAMKCNEKYWLRNLGMWVLVLFMSLASFVTICHLPSKFCFLQL